LGKLLALGVARSRRRDCVVSMDELGQAYRSVDYAGDREDLRILNEIAINGRAPPGRKDLLCPIELPLDEVSKAAVAARENLTKEVRAAVQQTALTHDERETLSAIKKAARTGTDNVRSLPRGKKPTVADLRKGEEAIYGSGGDA
jgi:hypothetical protein